MVRILFLLRRVFNLPLYFLAVLIYLIIRALKPIVLIRIGELFSSRIGHYAGNTEMYCCEQDAGINKPECRYVDLFYQGSSICNKQLSLMWSRTLRIYPKWLLGPVRRICNFGFGGAAHVLDMSSQLDRDVHNLLDEYDCHIWFTEDEMTLGYHRLRELGVPSGCPFICLIVRDPTYLNSVQPDVDWSGHSYRDVDVDNYVLACNTLAERGYYVFRMGAVVKSPLKSESSKVIDYASNGMRTDFMDIWLGAHCAFCVSVGTGFDAIPVIFRRPVVFVNMVPLGYFFSFRSEFIGLFKHHYQISSGQEMTLQEIVESGVHLSLETKEYADQGVSLKENSPEEIRDIVLEMADRVEEIWLPQAGDEGLQARFWQLYPLGSVAVYNGKPLHGDPRAFYGAVFLRGNQWWLK